MANVNPRTDQALLDAMTALQAALQAIGTPAMIIGGIAVIIRGVPRLTQDIDTTMWTEGIEIETVLNDLAGEGDQCFDGREGVSSPAGHTIRKLLRAFFWSRFRGLFHTRFQPVVG